MKPHPAVSPPSSRGRAKVPPATDTRSAPKAVLAAAIALIASGAQAQGLTPAPANVLTLSASASAEVTQDVLAITLAVTREGNDSAQVQGQIKQVLDAALAQARRSVEAGALDVRTGGFGLHPRYSDKGRITGWQGNAELIIEGKDTGRVAEVAGKLTELNVTSVDFRVSRDLRAQHEARVTADAIAAFRARASEIAKGFGMSGYTLREVNVNAADGQVPMPRSYGGAMMARVAADAPVPVEAGKAEITVTVSGSVVLQ